MKRTLLLFCGTMLAAVVACARTSDPISGPEGQIAYKITLPDGFDAATERCPMVILMHGIFYSKDYGPMPGRQVL